MKKLLLGLVGLLVIGILAGYGIGWYVQRDQQSAQRIPIVVEPELPARSVQLYFADPQGAYLQAEMRQIPGCEDDRDCIRSLLYQLSAGSQQGGLPVLPQTVALLAVELENDLVRLDFSQQLIDQHPGGSLSELLTVYSLVNSLAENFPYLRQLQILIDGQIRQTLKGHVRIDQPVYADFNFSRPPLAGPQAVAEAVDESINSEQQDTINE